MASEREIRQQARQTALELLVQHLIWRSFEQDVSAIEEYAAKVDQSLQQASMRGWDPAMSDHMASEIREQMAQILNDLIARAKAPTAPGS